MEKLKALVVILCLVVVGQSYWIYTIKKDIYDEISDTISMSSNDNEKLDARLDELSERITELKDSELEAIYDVLEEHDDLLDKIRGLGDFANKKINNTQRRIDQKMNEERSKRYREQMRKEMDANR